MYGCVMSDHVQGNKDCSMHFEEFHLRVLKVGPLVGECQYFSFYQRVLF